MDVIVTWEDQGSFAYGNSWPSSRLFPSPSLSTGPAPFLPLNPPQASRYLVQKRFLPQTELICSRVTGKALQSRMGGRGEEGAGEPPTRQTETSQASFGVSSFAPSSFGSAPVPARRVGHLGPASPAAGPTTSWGGGGRGAGWGQAHRVDGLERITGLS